MTSLELALLDALVAAEFWQHVGDPARIDWPAIQQLSRRLHTRARRGKALLVRKPSKLNP